MKAYWEGRKEKQISEGYGSYTLNIRYLENSNKAQVTMIDNSKFSLQVLWSHLMKDEQANAALTFFQAVGFFDIPIMEE